MAFFLNFVGENIGRDSNLFESKIAAKDDQMLPIVRKITKKKIRRKKIRISVGQSNFYIYLVGRWVNLVS